MRDQATPSDRDALHILLGSPLVRAGVLAGIGLEDDGAAVDALVRRIARMRPRQIRNALALAQQAAGVVQAFAAMASLPKAPTQEGERHARHVLYRDGLRIPPPRRPTSEDRCRENAEKWGFR